MVQPKPREPPKGQKTDQTLPDQLSKVIFDCNFDGLTGKIQYLIGWTDKPEDVRFEPIESLPGEMEHKLIKHFLNRSDEMLAKHNKMLKLVEEYQRQKVSDAALIHPLAPTDLDHDPTPQNDRLHADEEPQTRASTRKRLSQYPSYSGILDSENAFSEEVSRHSKKSKQLPNIEEILDIGLSNQNVLMFLTKWKGWEEPTWELLGNFDGELKNPEVVKFLHQNIKKSQRVVEIGNEMNNASYVYRPEDKYLTVNSQQLGPGQICIGAARVGQGVSQHPAYSRISNYENATSEEVSRRPERSKQLPNDTRAIVPPKTQGLGQEPVTENRTENKYTIEEILDIGLNTENVLMFLTKLGGWKEPTWELISNFDGELKCPKVVKFMDQNTEKSQRVIEIGNEMNNGSYVYRPEDKYLTVNSQQLGPDRIYIGAARVGQGVSLYRQKEPQDEEEGKKSFEKKKEKDSDV